MDMAIVKASYTRSRGGAKASIRYIQHRPGKDGQKTAWELFSADGVVDRQEAYLMIDAAGKGSIFFRIVISPDPETEDIYKDLYLHELTAETMTQLQELVAKPVSYVAATHDDHAPHRHVHVVASVQGRLTTQDLQALRATATAAALFQRQERDQAREQQEGGQWLGQGIS
jgi:hypothetical protein